MWQMALVPLLIHILLARAEANTTHVTKQKCPFLSSISSGALLTGSIAVVSSLFLLSFYVFRADERLWHVQGLHCMHRVHISPMILTTMKQRGRQWVKQAQLFWYTYCCLTFILDLFLSEFACIVKQVVNIQDLTRIAHEKGRERECVSKLFCCAVAVAVVAARFNCIYFPSPFLFLVNFLFASNEVFHSILIWREKQSYDTTWIRNCAGSKQNETNMKRNLLHINVSLVLLSFRYCCVILALIGTHNYTYLTEWNLFCAIQHAFVPDFPASFWINIHFAWLRVRRGDSIIFISFPSFICIFAISCIFCVVIWTAAVARCESRAAH